MCDALFVVRRASQVCNSYWAISYRVLENASAHMAETDRFNHCKTFNRSRPLRIDESSTGNGGGASRSLPPFASEGRILALCTARWATSAFSTPEY